MTPVAGKSSREILRPTPKIATILTKMMADDFNFSGRKIKNYIAEADADLIPVSRQLELHGRCRFGVLLSLCFGALYLPQI